MRLQVLAYTVATILLPCSADILVPISSHWAGGFQGEACFDITAELHGWTLTLYFDQPINTLDVYVADVIQTLDSGQTFVLTNKDFNADEDIGDRLCVAFIGHGDGDIVPKIVASLDGLPNGGGDGTVTHPPTSAPGPSLAPAATTENPASTPVGDGTVTNLKMNSDWGGRFDAQASFSLKEDVIGWVANFSFSEPVDKMEPSNGKVYYTSDDHLLWTVVSPADKPFYAAGATLTIQFYGNYPGAVPSGKVVLINMGKDTQIVTPLINADGSKYNYDDVLYKSILFYEAQRSGKLPPTNRIPWRGDSALDDKGDNGEDLTGGWYDAGDHIKFNFPMAYSTTILAWGFIEFRDAYEAAGQADWLLDSIKWPLDYFIKCHTGPQELYVQVGDAGPDHSYWGTPEMMTMARPAYKVTASKPGSDVVMETAAAMAAGYLAFNKTDPTYADTLLQHAKELWQFGSTHRGKYSDSVSAAAGFYRSYNETDELCWGSLWLYRATNESKYLAEAEKQFDPDPAWGQSWDEKTIGNQLLLYRAAGKDNYKQSVLNSYRGWFPGGDVTYTPKGLAWRLEWGSLRYMSNMAMIALVAAEYGLETDAYRHWAMCQMHYALGDTGFSYVIGFGDKYPLRPHHRSSSCPTLPAACGSGIMSGTVRNVHTLYGAMVGGPGSRDDYTDDRTNYVNNEVACDYNAGFQGAIAGLKHLWVIGEHPEQIGADTCPYSA